jgi:hypothetical protein
LCRGVEPGKKPSDPPHHTGNRPLLVSLFLPQEAFKSLRAVIEIHITETLLRYGELLMQTGKTAKVFAELEK